MTLSQYLENLLVQPTEAGVRVTERSALSVPQLFRAVDLASNKAAQCPLVVYRRTKDGRDRATDHAAYFLLKTRPSELYSASTWRKTMVWQRVLHGNSYSWIVRNGAGQPVELLLLDPSSTCLKHERGAYHYETQLDAGDKTKTVKIAFADVIHCKGMGNGLEGFSPLELMSSSIAEAIALQKYLHFMKTSGS